MKDFIFKYLPFLISMLISQFVYYKLNKKYKITDKISLKLHIKQDWLAFFFICFTFTLILIIGIMGIYLINISTVTFSIICGIATGITISMRYLK